MTAVTCVTGDITKQNVDAIVNAANTTLLGGGGVDGAIHRAAGPHLLDECKSLKGCPTGEAKITKGYKLRAKYIIHTVGPYYKGTVKDRELLKSCYINSLELARKMGIRSVAFPSISTGAYHFPIRDAASIAVTAVKGWISEHPSDLEEIRFVLFSDQDFGVYKNLLIEKLD